MEQCGPKWQVVRRWSIVSASPQSQFGSSVYPQRAAEALVFPTLHRALLREHHCFLFSAVPFVKVSLAGGIAGKRSAGVVAAHCCTLTLEVLLCVSGWTMAKLFVHFSRLLTSMWL